MTPRFVMEITADHVRNPRTVGFETFRKLTACMGRLLSRDVGKRVYDCGDGVWQVENDEQRDRRLGRIA